MDFAFRCRSVMILTMEEAVILLAWSVNLLVGIGLALLGVAMMRRPQRVWVGIRIARTPEEVAKVRRANLAIGPWILLLGLVEILSGPAAMVIGIPDLMLAVGGLATLLVAIGVVVLAAILSR